MTVHNLFFYLDMMRTMRQSIRLRRFEEFRAETLRALSLQGKNPGQGTVW
jgi:queuine/archaeosine tRNA-ribosyltransferase